jgi:hypothetical protein
MNRRGFFDLIGKGMTVIGLAKLPVLPAPKVVEELVGPEVAAAAEIPVMAVHAASTSYYCATGPVGPTGSTGPTGSIGAPGYIYDLYDSPRETPKPSRKRIISL